MSPIEIPDELAEAALETLRELNGKAAADSRDLRRERAATNLYKLYQVQQRYQLHPQTKADYERALQHPNRSGAKDLEAMTLDEILALQAELTKDYPGRPNNPGA
jgi:hypothetical protein